MFESIVPAEMDPMKPLPGDPGAALVRSMILELANMDPDVSEGVRIDRIAALEELKAAGSLPDLVVSLGSAGSRRLERTEVYQAVSVTYRDMNASAFGFERGVTPFLDLPATLPLPIRIPGVREATISTGATIIANSAFDGIGEDMVDMETYACLRACQIFGVPLVGLRGISDGDTDVDHIGDWLEYLHIVDEKLADAVRKLEAAIADGTISI